MNLYKHIGNLTFVSENDYLMLYLCYTHEYIYYFLYIYLVVVVVYLVFNSNIVHWFCEHFFRVNKYNGVNSSNTRHGSFATLKALRL